MDFELSEKHRIIQKQVYEFSREEIVPIIAEHDRKAEFPSQLLPNLGAHGFLGICLPVRYGGAGMDYGALAVVSEDRKSVV